MEKFSKRIDVLLDMHRYNVELGRSYLEYRERLTQMMIYVYTALFSLMFAFKLDLITVPFALMTIVMSRFAESFVLKFFERSEYHFCRAREIRHQIDVEFGEHYKGVEPIFSDALDKHLRTFTMKKHKKWAKRVIAANVHERWASVHRMFLLMGVGLLVLILVKAGVCQLMHVCLTFKSVSSSLLELLSNAGGSFTSPA